MKNSIVLIASIVMTLSSHAQAMKITGNVSDANGPLPGTIIVVKGSEKGTKTDFDGNFYIYAKKGESLVFSYLGFRTKTIKIKSNEKQLVEMREDATICFPPLDYNLPFKIHELKGYDENWQTTQDICTSLSEIPSVQLIRVSSYSCNPLIFRKLC